MENTKLNKEMFFAQYIEQRVLANTKGTHYPLVYLSKVWNWQHTDFYLELTPLSQISDEDKKMLENWNIGFIDKIESILSSIIIHISSASGIKTLIADVMTIDYLRSKGYALPYMGLSVEKQVEYGWVKLKTN